VFALEAERHAGAQHAIDALSRAGWAADELLSALIDLELNQRSVTPAESVPLAAEPGPPTLSQSLPRSADDGSQVALSAMRVGT
jgi:hypothetical protein